MSGSPETSLLLERAFEAGRNKNFPETIRLLEEAASLGSARACFELGWAHEVGNFGIVVDAQESEMWHRKHPEYLPSRLHLGVCHVDDVISLMSLDQKNTEAEYAYCVTCFTLLGGRWPVGRPIRQMLESKLRMSCKVAHLLYARRALELGFYAVLHLIPDPEMPKHKDILIQAGCLGIGAAAFWLGAREEKTPQGAKWLLHSANCGDPRAIRYAYATRRSSPVDLFYWFKRYIQVHDCEVFEDAADSLQEVYSRSLASTTMVNRYSLGKLSLRIGKHAVHSAIQFYQTQRAQAQRRCLQLLYACRMTRLLTPDLAQYFVRKYVWELREMVPEAMKEDPLILETKWRKGE